MASKTLGFVSILLTAVAMAGGFAHLFELPNKMDLSREEYFIVQQIYRGWVLLGIPIFGALISTLALTVVTRKNPQVFPFALLATICISLALGVFFLFTYPANMQSGNWTFMPDNWRELRRQWEYSHAAGAGLYLAAFIMLALSMRPDGGSQNNSPAQTGI
jgi:hypothetical protein